jgi:predicted HTH transcriptional regulator
MMSDMAVVVEPIVSREKLLALLDEQSESSTLDYKRTLNLGKGNAEAVVELAKDVAAMQSESAGGYIVIGADDHGVPVADLTADLAKHFDDATLRQKLGIYLTEPEVRSAQHEVDGQTLVLIYVAPSEHGWCIFKQPGEYERAGNGRPEICRWTAPSA